ncbi:MAG TPA: hypothetical protein VL096_15415 [Pirellulaceae bacterium]|nr:hypothetical protein [Pirellulaceae bacterium]
MIHFSCDRCKCMIDPEDELRYIVKLEVSAAMEPMDNSSVTDDRDHLLEVQEILERLEASDDENIGDDIYQKKSFDLCSNCYREFIKNPLGREQPMQLGFSPN